MATSPLTVPTAAYIDDDERADPSKGWHTAHEASRILRTDNKVAREIKSAIEVMSFEIRRQISDRLNLPEAQWREKKSSARRFAVPARVAVWPLSSARGDAEKCLRKILGAQVSVALLYDQYGPISLKTPIFTVRVGDGEKGLELRMERIEALHNVQGKIREEVIQALQLLDMHGGDTRKQTHVHWKIDDRASRASGLSVYPRLINVKLPGALDHRSHFVKDPAGHKSGLTAVISGLQFAVKSQAR